MPFSVRQTLLTAAYGAPEPSAYFDAREVRRILLVRRNGIGDMICALPLFRSVRAAFPQARVDVLASSGNAGVARSARVADEVMVYPGRSGLRRNKYITLFGVARELRSRAYDVVVSVSGGHSTFLSSIAFVSGAPWRLGYVPVQGLPYFAYSLPVDPAPSDEHQVLRCLRLLVPLGIAPTTIDLGFEPGEGARRYADETVQGPFVLYNASATRAWNAWPARRIVALAQALHHRHGLRVIVSGVARDRAMLAEISRSTSRDIAHVVEPPSIHHFAALALKSTCVMTGDGGTVHVGAAMKKPTFVLYPKGGNPSLWAPYGVPSAFVRSNAAVAEIEPETVMRELDNWLPRIGRGERI